MNAFSALRLRSGLAIDATAAEFATSVEQVSLWEKGEAQAPERVLRSLSILADFAPRNSNFVDDAKSTESIREIPHSKATENRHDRARKASFGQFLTQAPIATFMAEQLSFSATAESRVLDAGAGTGALSKAAALAWRAQGAQGELVMTAYEFDAAIHAELDTTFRGAEFVGIKCALVSADFIAAASTDIRLAEASYLPTRSLIRPIGKLHRLRRIARCWRRWAWRLSISTSGFVGLALELLEKGGQLVAIIPRSFCNGPYYRPFRRWILDRAAIRRLHLFGSRASAFHKDDVLQENVIVTLEKGGSQGEVAISTSTDGLFLDLQCHKVAFQGIVSPGDQELFIHIPTDGEEPPSEVGPSGHTLDSLGISVSTGPVVDFRMRGDLRMQPSIDTAPLIYPGHFANGRQLWPRPDFRKPNAIQINHSTRKYLYPSGFYVVVRRLSSKEEHRRVIASVFDGSQTCSPFVGFENHLNVFHRKRQPLERDEAEGLSAFLNSAIVDRAFRRFNGHTQVNATDLRALRYPSLANLRILGEMCRSSVGTFDVDAPIGDLR